LIESSQEYTEAKQAKEEKEQRLAELKSDTFGSDSKEVEQKARSMFEDVGLGDGEGRTQEIDKVEQELRQAEQTVNELKDDLLQNHLTEIRFPFNEIIDQRSGEIVFPFTDEIPKETIEAICDVVRNDVESGSVEFQSEGLVVETENVDQAIDAVERFAEDLRDSARHELNTDEYVEKLVERDPKVQRMLYELYESDDLFAKKELEERTGVEKGGLRGVLYHVYDNDPYLVKEDQKYELSEIGRTVVEKYVEDHGEPDMPESESDSTEESEENGEEEQEQITISSAGESNE